MDLNIVLWIGGMLFSLSIFAVKVGLGLGYGKVKAKGVSITLAGYVLLFVGVALLSQTLMRILEPLLRKGPYLHILIATGMIAWGFFTIRGLRHTSRSASQSECCGVPIVSTLLLITPCPVCIAAMAFSTWSAITAIKLPAAWVGLGLGLSFAAITLVVMALTRLRAVEHPETALGLAMITVGLYFIASLFLPAKIEEAKGMYQSFLTEGANIALNNTIGVFVLLFVAFVIGYLANKKGRVNE